MVDLSFAMHKQGAWDEDWCARLAPLNKIRGLAWGNKLRIKATIWRGNVHQSVHLCEYIQMRSLRLFKERVSWRLPNLWLCLEVEMGEELAGLLCKFHHDLVVPFGN
jgi:hypothetical protein